MTLTSRGGAADIRLRRGCAAVPAAPVPLFRKRTAAKPSSTAAPKNAVGCLRAKSCTLPTISDMSRLRMASETFCELGGRLADVMAGLRDIAVELVGGAANDICDIADIIGARRLSARHGGAQLFAGDRMRLPWPDSFRLPACVFIASVADWVSALRLVLHVASEFRACFDHAFGLGAERPVSFPADPVWFVPLRDSW